MLTEIGRRADAEARRQAETELQRTTDRLRGLLDHSPAMILGRDLEGRYLFVNRAGERALGMPEDAAIGKLGAQALRAHDDAVIAAGAPLEVEETLELEGGTVLLRSVKFPLTDEAGEPYGVCAICTEVAAPAAAAAEMPSEVNLGLGLGELSSRRRCCGGWRRRSTPPSPRSRRRCRSRSLPSGADVVQREISLARPGAAFTSSPRDVVGELPELGELKSACCTCSSATRRRR